jgi:ribosomal protein S18 acetylase RimI-like enzyme
MATVVMTRLGRPADFERALEVWHTAHDARLGHRLPPEHETRVRSYLHAAGVFFLIAVDGDDVIGGALAMQGRADDGAGPLVPGLCHVSMVFVAANRWGEGVGSQVLDALVAEARTRLYERLQLWTHADNSRAQRLFERAGFRRTGREKPDDLGAPTVQYARPL